MLFPGHLFIKINILMEKIPNEYFYYLRDIDWQNKLEEFQLKLNNKIE